MAELSADERAWGTLVVARVAQFCRADSCAAVFVRCGGNKRVSEESDRMMVLLQELTALKRAGKSEEQLISKKRRKEITKEMKQLALQKKENSQ